MTGNASAYLPEQACAASTSGRNAKLMRISEHRALAQTCTLAYQRRAVPRPAMSPRWSDSVMKIMEAEKELDAQIDLLVDTEKRKS